MKERRATRSKERQKHTKKKKTEIQRMSDWYSFSCVLNLLDLYVRYASSTHASISETILTTATDYGIVR